MARFQERMAWNSPSVDTGQAEYHSNLAGKLQDYSGTLMSVHRDVRVAEAQEDAQAANPRSSELQDNVTVYGKAYNNVLIRSNQAAIKSDYSIKLEELATEHQRDPKAFAEHANAIRSDMLANALPPVRQMAEIDYDNLSSSYLNHIKSVHKKESLAEADEERDNAYDRFRADIARFISRGDDKSAYEGVGALKTFLAESTYSTAEQADLLDIVQKDIDKQLQFNILENYGSDFNGAREYIAGIADDVPENYHPDEWQQFIGQAGALVNSRENLATKSKIKLTREQEKMVSDVEIAIDSDLGDPLTHTQAVDELWDKGWITPGKRTELKTRINKNVGLNNDALQMTDSITQLREGDMSQRVTIKDSDLDKDYAQLVASADRAGQPWSNAHKAMYASQVRYIPKGMKRELHGLMHSGNLEQIREGADLIDRLDDMETIDIKQIDEELYAIGAQFNTMSTYMPEEEAAKKVMEITDPGNRRLIEERRAQIRDMGSLTDRREDYRDKVADAFDKPPGLIADQMAVDYADLYEGMYIAGFTDEDELHDRVIKQMGKVWGESQIHGKTRFMRHPYENVYGPIGMDLAKKDLHKVTRNYVRKHYKLENISEKNIMLIGDNYTRQLANSGKPSYLVYVNLPTGITPLYDRETGDELRWGPPLDELQYAHEKFNEDEEARRVKLEKDYRLKRKVKRRNIENPTMLDELYQFGQ